MVRAQLSDPAFAVAWAEGQRMPFEQAIAYAQADQMAVRDAGPAAETGTPAMVPAHAAPQSYPAGLTARAVEVLRLLAQGLTNAQIAEHLIVSPRTVNAHLTSIYGKLQVTSRAAATRFAVEQGIV